MMLFAAPGNEEIGQDFRASVCTFYWQGRESWLSARRTAAAVLSILMMALAALSAPSRADEYSQKISPIFARRCVACHSCYNAPCQLNLQSYSGATRGATTRNVYDASRLSSVPPTRLDIDATTQSAWRDKGFHDVLGAGDPQKSLLLRLTRMRKAHASLQPKQQAADSQLCVVNPDDERLDDDENKSALGMPYGFPPLSGDELAELQAWIESGAKSDKAPSALSARGEIPAALREEVQAWERFLNAPGPRQKLVSRYLYEHLFLAHIYFASDTHAAANAAAEPAPPHFFRLVRSRTACDSGIEEVATRRPTDPTGMPETIYCLRPFTAVIVEKTHIPFELSPQKLDRVKALFLSGDWNVGEAELTARGELNNPFATFAAIPVKARYQFLLDNAHFYVATFIKGPVCNGSAAVNSIQEQFFVFFLKPEADSMAMLPDFAAAAISRLILPGARGSDVTVFQDLPFLTRIVDYREEYRKLRAESVRKLRPNGYALDDIWDGDGSNPNALLTVFRHDDNAAVFKGAIGDLPKTIFVLDYPLFERLVYNLVVNFDVFGNVGHQVLTRVYMDLIRMEAEELFLSFLPPPDRVKLRKAWYRGDLLTDIKLNIIFPLTNQDLPTAIAYHGNNHKLEFVQRALFERLPGGGRGPSDSVNWRSIHLPAGGEAAPFSQIDHALSRIASIPAKRATPFARYFPELSIAVVRGSGGNDKVFSIIHNREHKNVSWIMGEDQRLAPSEDTLTVREGILGAYPNMLFDLDEAQVGAFTHMASRIASVSDYQQLVDRFGVRRSSDRFWPAYDVVNAIGHRMQPIDSGVLDLTRYQLEGR